MNFLTLLLLFFSIQTYASIDMGKRIEKVCQKMHYKDCSLVKAIVKIESNFNPLSVGADGKGSLGLTQIMCDTAWTLDRINGRRSINCNRLFIPEVNIQYGIEYLNHLESLLSIKPNLYELLSAYNGGYAFNRRTKSYEVKRCNAISRKKGRLCRPGEPFNIAYAKKVISVYLKIKGD